MGIKTIFTESVLAKYVQAIRQTPREMIANPYLLLSAALYAMTAVPATWDQGSSAVVPSLPGFEEHFHISSGSNAGAIKNFISLIYIGYGVGAALSFFINDRVGRRWSFRIYTTVYTLGQLIAVSAPNLETLYAGRVVAGLGIGAFTVLGPMTLAEIAPAEIRGVLISWFTVAMAASLVSAIFCVLGVYLHISTSKLQFQIVWFSPCIFLFLCCVASFWLSESPRWLALIGRHDEAVTMLSRLRGLPASHPRVALEIDEMHKSILESGAGVDENGNPRAPGIVGLLKEMFTTASNLRRLQQVLLCYALAQLSGANSVTSYFVPILRIAGLAGEDTSHSIFLSGMYGVAKFGFALIASFFFIDALGRRRSLFLGASVQMVTDIYLAAYIKVRQDSGVSKAASEGALAMLFIHAFGYCVGLFILPYVFGGEVWPNRLRSFGGALGQTFHWFFIYAMQFGLPSLLERTHNWGAFVFFASFCFIAVLYVFFMVPEVSGLNEEQIQAVFSGPAFNAFKRINVPVEVLDSADSEEFDVDGAGKKDTNSCKSKGKAWPNPKFEEGRGWESHVSEL